MIDKKKHLPYKKAGAFGDPYSISRALANRPQDGCPPVGTGGCAATGTGCSIPVRSCTEKQLQRKSTCLTRKQVLLVTRTGIEPMLQP